MTIASIDIGSNTVLLLIAEYDPSSQRIVTIENHYKTPRLGEGLKLGDTINETKINLLRNILLDYKNIVLKNGCSVILLKATNAFRIASNSTGIVNFIKKMDSLKIEIISGDEEARLTFLGSAFPFSDNETKSVIDIGGGSTEIIYGNQKEIFFKKSFDIGVVSLSEKFLLPLPPSKESIEEAEKYLDRILLEISDILPPNVKTIAVAGTPTTLSCIKQGIRIYDEKLVDNSTLTTSEIQYILDQLKKIDKLKVSLKYGEVVNGREELMLAGTIILQIIMQKLKLENITVSSKGLRYGAVIDYLIKNQLMTAER